MYDNSVKLFLNIAEGGEYESMKIQWNKRYTTIMFYAMLVILCVTAIIFIIMDFSGFWKTLFAVLSKFNPIFYGIVIAYLLTPFLNFVERRILSGLDRTGRYRLKRTLAIVIVYVLSLVAFVLLVWIVVPQVLRGYLDLQNMAGWYLEAVKVWIFDITVVDGFLAGYWATVTEYFVGLLEQIYYALGLVIPDIGVVVGAAVGVVMDIVLGIMLSIYYIASKEKLLAQMKKLSHAIFRKKRYKHFAKSLNLANKNFGGFIKGQFADALILGTACYICAMIIGIPYYPLVSVLVGILSIVPVVGPLIGTVAGSLIILLADPLSMLWFVILMVCLLFINRRLLKPRILRTGVEASSIFMFTAILITTGLVGVWGLILGVPVFAILYTIIHSAVDQRLAKKGYITDIYAYYSTEAGRELHIEDEYRRAKQAEGTLFSTRKPGQLFTEEFPAMPDSSEFLAMNTADFTAMTDSGEMPAVNTADFEVYSETIATEDRVITSEIPIPKDLEEPETKE